MSPSDDDDRVKRRLDERSADALLSGRGGDRDPLLAAFVADLTAQREATVPDPNAALAALLAGGLDLTAAVTPPALPQSTAWTRLRQAVSWRQAGRPSWALPLQLGLGGAACLSLILGAAAANELPAPVQTAVADVVEAVTPLDVPRPHVQPSPVSPVVPAPSTEATDDSTDGSDDGDVAATTGPSARATERGSEGSDNGEDRGEPQLIPSSARPGDDRSEQPEDRATRTPGSDDRKDDEHSQAPTTRPTVSPTADEDHSGDRSGSSQNE